MGIEVVVLLCRMFKIKFIFLSKLLLCWRTSIYLIIMHTTGMLQLRIMHPVFGIRTGSVATRKFQLIVHSCEEKDGDWVDKQVVLLMNEDFASCTDWHKNYTTSGGPTYESWTYTESMTSYWKPWPRFRANGWPCYGVMAVNNIGICSLQVLPTATGGRLTTVTILNFFSLSICALLTPCSTVLLEKLTGLQLVKKFPAFYGTRWFFTAFRSLSHLSLSWDRSIQYLPHSTSLKTILILFPHVCLGIPVVCYLQLSPPKTYTGIPRYTRSHFTRFRYNAI
jgi:hypothetical protein